MSYNRRIMVHILLFLLLRLAVAYKLSARNDTALRPLSYIQHVDYEIQGEYWRRVHLKDSDETYYTYSMLFNDATTRGSDNTTSALNYAVNDEDGQTYVIISAANGCIRPSSQGVAACESSDCFCNCVLGNMKACNYFPTSYHYIGFWKNPSGNTRVIAIYEDQSCSSRTNAFRKFSGANVCFNVNKGFYVRSYKVVG